MPLRHLHKPLRDHRRIRKYKAHLHDDPIDAEVAALADDRERLLKRYAQLSEEEVINLSVAENVLTFPELKHHLNSPAPITDYDMQYQESVGQPDFNTGLVHYLNDTHNIQPPLIHSIDADGNHEIGKGEQIGDVSCCSSVRCALEILSQSIYEIREKKYEENHDESALPKRGVMIPTPFWHGFTWVYEDRCKAEIYEVELSKNDNYDLSIEKLNEAYEEAESEGCKPQILLLTQPNNPIGFNYTKEKLNIVCDWAHSKNVSVISDEIYGHCQANVPGRVQFTTIMNTEGSKSSSAHVHGVWGIAKDFGLSGLRVGAIMTRNEQIKKRVRSSVHAYFSPMTSTNNWLLNSMFTSKKIYDITHKLYGRITHSNTKVKEALRQTGIKYWEDGGYSAQFVWLDLSEYLVYNIPQMELDKKHHKFLDFKGGPTEETLFEKEEELDVYLTETAKVILLRGKELASEDPGMFRLCYTAKEPEIIVKAIRQIKSALDNLVAAQ